MTKICLQPQREIIFLEVGKRNNFIDTELLQIAYRDSVEVQSMIQETGGLRDHTSLLALQDFTPALVPQGFSPTGKGT